MRQKVPICILLLVLAVTDVRALPNPEGDQRGTKFELDALPVLHRRIHYGGSLYAKIGNDARIGQPGGIGTAEPEASIIGHDAQFEFPAESRNDYLFNGSLWVGGIVGGDTLVSEAVDGASDDANEYNGFTGISESYEPITGRQSFTANYFDTLILPTTSDEIALRPHRPLGLSITQKSHVFRTPPFDQFVIIEYTIRNISQNLISNAYVGIFADPDVWPQTVTQYGSEGPADDLAGFLEDECVAYAMDNDGDPQYATRNSQGNPILLPDTTWAVNSVRDAFSIAPIKIVPEPTDSAFNWWATNFSAIDWGPARAAATFGPMGIPYGDVNRYLTMSNSEFDYDQLWSAVDMSAEGWGPGALQPGWRTNLANGLDTRVLLSFGSFEIAPGDSVRAAFVLAAGSSIHAAPTDYMHRFSDSEPSPYYGTLDFTNLLANVRRAKRVHELGFQLPGAPPTQLIALPASQNSVRCTWSPAPFEGVSGYRLYRRRDGHQFELLATPGELDSMHVDRYLEMGTKYEYAITALDAGGDESTISMVVAATPGKPTEVPHLSVRSIRGTINVVLNTPYAPIPHSPLEYINLYRWTEDSPDPELIHRVPVPTLRYIPSPLAGRGIGQIESARARDDQWPRNPSVDQPPSFIDHDVESGKRYYYSASVTNRLGFEGDRSSERSAYSMAMDRRGLIIFHTFANTDGLVNADSLRAFYGPWAGARSFDSLSINAGGLVTRRDTVTSFEEISHYPIVTLVMEDDDPIFPRPWSPSTGLYKWLSDYSKAGGRIVLVARHGDSTSIVDSHRMLQEFAGVRRGYRERWVVTSGGLANWESYIRFREAVPVIPKYPPLVGDSVKARNFQYIANVIAATAHHYVGGFIPAVGFLDDLYPGTEALYTFRSDQPDTSFFEGRVVGVRRLTDSTGGVIMFAFPLSLIKYDQAWNALSIAVDDLGADTSWTSLEPDVDVSAHILQWLYQPTSTVPNPAWDVNRDGVIDIRDVVETLQGR